MNHSNSASLIILCGFMSCGKTSIGKPLAERLGYTFVDTDDLLLDTYHMTIPEMFAKGGETLFRDCEHEIALKAASMQKSVISTGGGLITFERNARALAEKGIIIYINQDFDVCYERLMNQPERPLNKNHSREELRARYDARVPSYQKYASYTLTRPDSVENAVEEILSFLRSQ
ncbi:MAG: shikimate kinase [Clostridiales bacterium]|nr:shikimate kinase [Clostridiales bacterium]